MSTQNRPFKPLAPTQSTAVTATAQRVNLNFSLGTFQIRFCNAGNQMVFILPGEISPVAATFANAIPIPAGQTEVFSFSPGTTSYSVIAGDVGSILYSTVGEGV